jgi:hypothetical protein
LTVSALYAQALQLQDQLAATILANRRDDGLLPSGPGDDRTSLTVAGFAAFALRRARMPEADALVTSMLHAERRGGAWLSQDGAYQHVLATALPLRACAELAPVVVDELAVSADWLVERQHAGGWAFLPGREARAVYTALALHSLSVFAASARACGSPSTNELVERRVVPAVETGIAWLRGFKLEQASRDLGAAVWGNRQGAASPCLCSTATVYEALLAISYAVGPDEPGDVSLAAGEALLSTALISALAGDRSTDGAWSDLWPVIYENNPNYWYRYFVPRIALNALTDPGASSSQSAVLTIEWLLAHSFADSAGNYFVAPRPDAADECTIWAVANALTILSAWCSAYRRDVASATARLHGPPPPRSGPLSAHLALLAEHYTSAEEVHRLARDAGLPTDRFTNRTARDAWRDVSDYVARDPLADVALRVVIARDKGAVGDALLDLSGFSPGSRHET